MICIHKFLIEGTTSNRFIQIVNKYHSWQSRLSYYTEEEFNEFLN